MAGVFKKPYYNINTYTVPLHGCVPFRRTFTVQSFIKPLDLIQVSTFTFLSFLLCTFTRIRSLSFSALLNSLACFVLLIAVNMQTDYK